MGISHEEIIKDIRQSSTLQEIKRIHFVKRKDLHNIKKSFNIDFPMKTQEIDWSSIRLWVKRMGRNNPNPVLFFKQPGEEDYSLVFDTDDFCLIIMTDFQLHQMMLFGSDTVCIDGTDRVNTYYFHLYTIVVLNESDQAIPVAFCYCNRADISAYAHFFYCIKQHTGEINPTVFMSHDEEVCYNAWCTVMGQAETLLLCTWQVLKTWQNNLRKIKSQDKRKRVFKTLQILLKEPDEDKLNENLATTLSDLLNDLDTEDFGLYFHNYVEKVTKWACCYRKHLRINMNMDLETFHKKLKHCYLNGKTCKQLHQSIVDILSLLHDKIFYPESLKLPEPASKIQESHQKSIQISRGMISEYGSNKWLVNSSNGKTIYIVEKSGDCPSEICLLRCDDCQICIHSFECSCESNSIYYIICKHIHACVREFFQGSDMSVTLECAGSEEENIELSVATTNDSIVDQFQLKFSMLLELSKKAENYDQDKNRNLMKDVDMLIAKFQNHDSSSSISKPEKTSQKITPLPSFSTKITKQRILKEVSFDSKFVCYSDNLVNETDMIIEVNPEFHHNYCKVSDS